MSGFEACRAAKSGLEAAGIGGGAAAPSKRDTEIGLAAGTGGFVVVPLLRPSNSADFLGGGGSTTCLWGLAGSIGCGGSSSCIDGVREGSPGAGNTFIGAAGGGVVPTCFC